MVSEAIQLQDTWRAFEHAAADYDGPAGNNILVQGMRAQMWQTLRAIFPAGARLLDLGCGTGIDAVYLADNGYSVLALDSSQRMIDRTRSRIAENGVERRVSVRVWGIHELDQLQEERFDGIYSNLGALNCVPDLNRTARACAALLRPGGCVVTSVIGRVCPWEFAYYVPHAQWKRASLRWSATAVPVPLNDDIVWTKYFMPRQFYQAFAEDFELTFYRSLRLCSPPPYMLGVYNRLRPLCVLGEWLDDRIGALPIFRNAGDHFLMVMRRRG